MTRKTKIYELNSRVKVTEDTISEIEDGSIEVT